MKQTMFVVLMEVFIIYWWLCLAYSRHRNALRKAAEDAKYGIWDKAYKKALKEDKGLYHAVTQAVVAVGAKQEVLKLWQDTYNKHVGSGVRTYTAGVKASAAAREHAHRDKPDILPAS